MLRDRKHHSTILLLILGLFPIVLGLFLLRYLPAQEEIVNYLTHHLNNARTGWNDREMILTPDNVRNGGLERKWLQSNINGQVYGAPLYYAVGGKEYLFIVTQTNFLYALDAADGTIRYGHVIGQLEGRPERHLSQFEFDMKSGGGCGDINPNHGITSTPVIDPATNTLYLVNLTMLDGQQTYRAHAIDIFTGREITDPPGWPATIQGQFIDPPAQPVLFQPYMQTQRGALTLHNGVLYIPFSSRCDAVSWHGWIMGVNVGDPQAPQYIMNTSPDGNGAGMWGQGGMSMDPYGWGYAVTGNGTVNGVGVGTGRSYSMSVLRIDPTNYVMPFSRTLPDFFIASDFGPTNARDTDLGGSSTVVIPEQPASMTPRLLLTAGKDGRAYLLNRDYLGGLSRIQDPTELQRLRVSAGMRVAPAYANVENDDTRGPFTYVTGTGMGTFMDWEDGPITVSTAGGSLADRCALGSGPAAAEFNNQLFIAWVSNTTGREVRVRRSQNGTTWSEASRGIGGNAAIRTSPALTVFNKKLYLSWIDNASRRIMIKSSEDGVDWTGETQMLDTVFADTEGFNTYTSITVFNGSLHLAFFANNDTGEILLKDSADGINWSANRLLYRPPSGLTPISAPCLIPFEDKLYALWLRHRDDRTIVFKTSTDGSEWLPAALPTSFNESVNQHSGLNGYVLNSVIEGLNPGPPRLHILFLANNLARTILVKSFNTAGSFGEAGNQTTYEGATGSSPVGAAVFGGKVFFAFVANNPGRNILLKPGVTGFRGRGLTALRLTVDPNTGISGFHPAWTSATNYDYLPGSPFVTSYQGRNGIVWVTEGGVQGPPPRLRGYDAVTGAELNPVTENLPNAGRKFENTVVVNGRVYNAALGVVCYGLR